MLDLAKLARQLPDLSRYLSQEATAAQRRLTKAEQILRQAIDQQAGLLEQQTIWRDRLGFTAASPIEPLQLRQAIPIAPSCHGVVATDGSQISPSHHEIAYCYLINIGRVGLHYGQRRHPWLDSVPEVFFQPEDLYACRQWGIRTEEWLGYCRTGSEATALAEMGLALRQQDPNLPIVALVDGSLIHWSLESLPAEARDRLLPPILKAWDQLHQANIPLIGYVSAARSSEALNFLRLSSCPFPEPDCLTHCPGQAETAACQVFAPLSDAALWATQLEPGQRSPLWKSAAPILRHYGEHTIFFVYFQTGSEVARVECPQWVATQPKQLELALAITLAQVQKGYGYPVALAEAHNQAVVRGGDRASFFALIEREMVKSGLHNVGISAKEARKRGSIA